MKTKYFSAFAALVAALSLTVACDKENGGKEEDPSIRVEKNVETTETILWGQGELHLDVLVDRIAEVWKMKNSVIRPSGRDVAAAAGLLYDSLAEKSVTWYFGQDALRDSAVTSTKRTVSGGWGFGGEDPAPIEAAALALWGAKTSKRDPSRRMRIG